MVAACHATRQVPRPRRRRLAARVRGDRPSRPGVGRRRDRHRPGPRRRTARRRAVDGSRSRPVPSGWSTRSTSRPAWSPPRATARAPDRGELVPRPSGACTRSADSTPTPPGRSCSPTTAISRTGSPIRASRSRRPTARSSAAPVRRRVPGASRRGRTRRRADRAGARETARRRHDRDHDQRGPQAPGAADVEAVGHPVKRLERIAFGLGGGRGGRNVGRRGGPGARLQLGGLRLGGAYGRLRARGEGSALAATAGAADSSFRLRVVRQRPRHGAAQPRRCPGSRPSARS